MYTAVRSYPGSSQLVDVLTQNEGEIKQIIGGIDGFKAYYLVRTGDGDAMSISVFDDQAGAEESSRRAAEWVKENAGDAAVSPNVEAGEVVISF